jgi:carboxyl-terminal processing protease
MTNIAWFSRPSGLARTIVLCGVVVGCGTTSSPPASVDPTTAPVPDPRLQPVFIPAPATTAEARHDQKAADRRDIVEAVWRTVRERHFDPKLGGIDWDAVRRRYEPVAVGAPGEAAFYRALNDMVGELGQSHMMVTGPGAQDDESAADADAEGAIGVEARTSTRTPELAPGPAPSGGGAVPPPTAAEKPRAPAAPGMDATAAGAPVAVTGVGDPGLIVRVIEGRPTVTAVRPGSSAARHRIAPGFIVTRIGGRPLSTSAHSKRPLRPVEERFAVRRAALHRLQGPSGTKVTLEYLDNDDRPGQVILDRDAPIGPVRQIGHLPPLHPEARITEIDGVGVIAFNIFLLDPLLDEIKHAMDRFRSLRVRAVVLDLRGNPGGLGAMAIPIAAEFVANPTTLGTLQFRTFAQTFVAQPSLGRTPYAGPLAILTDEGTASASEILAAGLQEAGRARVIGDATLGAVLPSVVEALPHGAVMQVVVADFKTPKGILVEGRGVQPDRRVVETRAALRAGRDPVMDAALAVIKTLRSPH